MLLQKFKEASIEDIYKTYSDQVKEENKDMIPFEEFLISYLENKEK